jgi:hypothetical protein
LGTEDPEEHIDVDWEDDKQNPYFAAFIAFVDLK